jgi:S1-C subfamily serine protease
LREKKAGDEVEVKVLRNGMPLTVKVVLTTRP